MIIFQTWLTQVVKYCSLIVNRSDLRRAWVGKDFSTTSVTDFDELYEQIFDDLDSDTFDAELEIHLPTDTAAREALSKFLGAIRRIDSLKTQQSDLNDPQTMLQSDAWRNVELAAALVISGVNV